MCDSKTRTARESYSRPDLPSGAARLSEELALGVSAKTQSGIRYCENKVSRMEPSGLEPPTFWLQTRRSPS